MMKVKPTILLLLTLAQVACVVSLDDEGVCFESRIEGRVQEQHGGCAVADMHVRLTVDGESVAATSTSEEGYFSLTATVEQLSRMVSIELRADSLYENCQREFRPEGFGRKTYDVGIIYVAGPRLPEVRSVTIGNPSATEVRCRSAVDDNGRSAVVQRGFVFSTMQYPTVNDGRVDVGSGVGEYEAVVGGLQPGTQYYLRAFATNGTGTAYGEQCKTTTLVGLPIVITNEVQGITATSATCGGVAQSDAGFGITARGVCWSTSPEPTVSHTHSTDGSGLGQFVSTLAGLHPGTTYYVRAYATNSVGTSYGEQRMFATESGLPEVSTGEVSVITATSAQCTGTVGSDGGFGVTARGVCYSTSPQPTTVGLHTTDGAGVGQYISHLTGLTPATQYHLRAYATNAAGTLYGEELTFITAE